MGRLNPYEFLLLLELSRCFQFYQIYHVNPTAQKLKFSINDFFSKRDQIRRKLPIWSHLLNKSLMKTAVFVKCP